MAGTAIDDILDFWFGRLDEHGLADADHSARWWKKDPGFDEQIRTRFEEVHRAIGAGELDDWLTDPRGRLAQVIALDQFSRNMYRGTPGMFASDPRALQLVLDGLDRGHDRELAPDPRAFFYMPLVHAEDLASQERAVALFSDLRDSMPPDLQKRAAEIAKYAGMHRDIVARFGRFPHRNAILGRASTPEEVAFLAQPGSSF
jgi:uncharacterized protein (DUF924 family)